ncbi:hypothetical protein B0T25DRAFT_346785 [Lasiosphaeria hispida]|uniref:Uncharacterized protein n=1 Tax=Lasiosphaeria hispida TaxID=260671 RepID=A0AAJ0M8N4_9PEZI|nr:hypothetical protein B0T25DRAFT_346785 [Lasiosphaeria hispida]
MFLDCLSPRRRNAARQAIVRSPSRRPSSSNSRRLHSLAAQLAASCTSSVPLPSVTQWASISITSRRALLVGRSAPSYQRRHFARDTPTPPVLGMDPHRPRPGPLTHLPCRTRLAQDPDAVSVVVAAAIQNHTIPTAPPRTNLELLLLSAAGLSTYLLTSPFP